MSETVMYLSLILENPLNYYFLKWIVWIHGSSFYFNLFHLHKGVLLVSIDYLSLPCLRTLKIWRILINFRVRLEVAINAEVRTQVSTSLLSDVSPKCTVVVEGGVRTCVVIAVQSSPVQSNAECAHRVPGHLCTLVLYGYIRALQILALFQVFSVFHLSW